MQCLAILPQYNTLCCVTVYRVASILRMITDLTIMISNVTGCFQAARLNPTHRLRCRPNRHARRCLVPQIPLKSLINPCAITNISYRLNPFCSFSGRTSFACLAYGGVSFCHFDRHLRNHFFGCGHALSGQAPDNLRSATQIR